MKSFFALIVLFIGTSAQAYNEKGFKCIGNKAFGTSTEVQMTLTALRASVFEVPEGTRVPYRLVLSVEKKIWADVQVMAEQEDVVFQFSSKTKQFGKISGTVFADELDHSVITINDFKFNMDCGAE